MVNRRIMAAILFLLTLLVYLACTGRPRPREVLGLLTGDVEARWSAGNITREQAWQLWAALPQAAQALLDHGPFLTNKAMARSTALNPLAYDGGGSQ